MEKGVPFVQKDPALKLYLFGNRLQHVPGAIFNLEFLTVLSLRGNGLRELPPAISKLKNLTQLNVAQNALRSLPAELLELIASSDKLDTLALFPNPFYRPQEPVVVSADDTSNEASPNEDVSTGSKKETLAWLEFHGHLRGDILARSPVQFSDTTGKIYSSFALNPRSEKLATEGLLQDAELPSTTQFRSKFATSSAAEEHSRVPSLLEVSLQACYRAPQVNELPHLLPQNSPPHLSKLLQKAHLLRETGGLRCSVCKRRLVQPRAEWIEWWELKHPATSTVGDQVVFVPMNQNEEERAVPFIRRGCSWKCLPQRVLEVTMSDEEMAN